MKSFNRAAACVLLASLFGLSACDRWHHDAGGWHWGRGDHDIDRHDDHDRRCDADHHGDGCRDPDRH